MGFWDKVDKTDGCWLWTAGCNNWGYGAFRNQGAHTVSWKLSGRTIPKGMCLLHRCDVRRCVNPDHLFVGTRADNQHDMKAKGRAARGVKNARSILKDEAVLSIYNHPNISHRLIAAKFKVSRGQVSRIKRGAAWSWLTQGEVP